MVLLNTTSGRPSPSRSAAVQPMAPPVGSRSTRWAENPSGPFQ